MRGGVGAREHANSTNAQNPLARVFHTRTVGSALRDQGEASTRFAAPTGARDTCGLKKDVSDTDAFSADLVASAAAEVASG